MNSAEIQKTLNSCWTVQEVCRRYNVTPMTVYLWRTRRNKRLPSIIINGDNRPSIRFVPAEVKSWVKENGIRVKA